MVDRIKNIEKQMMPAPNGRFCEMAAVAPQKGQCKFGSLYPAASFVEAATFAKPLGRYLQARRQRGGKSLGNKKVKPNLKHIFE
jgi:hypothetical protein